MSFQTATHMARYQESLTVLSTDAYAISLPSGDNATTQANSRWHRACGDLLLSQNPLSLSVLSVDADATSVDRQQHPRWGTLQIHRIYHVDAQQALISDRIMIFQALAEVSFMLLPP